MKVVFTRPLISDGDRVFLRVEVVVDEALDVYFIRLVNSTGDEFYPPGCDTRGPDSLIARAKAMIV